MNVISVPNTYTKWLIFILVDKTAFYEVIHLSKVHKFDIIEIP